MYRGKASDRDLDERMEPCILEKNELKLLEFSILIALLGVP